MMGASGGQYSFDLRTVHADAANRTLDRYIASRGIELKGAALKAYEQALLHAGTSGTVYVPNPHHPYDAVIRSASGSSRGVDLYSLNGADTLVASASGNDTLHAGSFHDTVIGGAGQDTLYGSTSSSGGAILESGSEAGRGGSQLFAGKGADTLIGGAGHDTLWGSQGSQGALLEAGSGATVLHAGRADDTVIGGSGQDTLYGSTSSTGGALLEVGTGNNLLYAGRGFDTLEAGSGHDRLYGSGLSVTEYGSTSKAGGATMYAGDARQAHLYGGSGADTLYGGAGADTLVAGTGNEVLEARPGADTLHGGGWGQHSDHGTGSRVVFDLSNPNIGNDTVWGGGGLDPNATTVLLDSETSSEVKIHTEGNETTLQFMNASHVKVTETLHNITEIDFKDGAHKI